MHILEVSALLTQQRQPYKKLFIFVVKIFLLLLKYYKERGFVIFIIFIPLISEGKAPVGLLLN